MEDNQIKTPPHRFLLLPEGSINYDQYSIFLGKNVKSDPHIQIPDAALIYLVHTLDWVPSINPQNIEKGRGFGLNMYGATIINETGADILRHITTSWANLFSLGPQMLALYKYKEVSYGESGEEILTTKQFEVSRDDFILFLRSLSEFAIKTMTGEYFILHIGL